jgi:uncharacterized membrane protein
VFATLAIPLALEGRWTSVAWALEGAAIVWIGVRQQRLAARVFGIALQFLAGVAFLADEPRHRSDRNREQLLPRLPVPRARRLFCAWY